jgi:hypothetical protein
MSSIYLDCFHVLIRLSFVNAPILVHKIKRLPRIPAEAKSKMVNWNRVMKERLNKNIELVCPINFFVL